MTLSCISYKMLTLILRKRKWAAIHSLDFAEVSPVAGGSLWAVYRPDLVGLSHVDNDVSKTEGASW